MVLRTTALLLLGAWLGAWTTGCVDPSNGEVPVADVPASQLSIEPTLVDADPAPPDGQIAVVVQLFHANNYVRLGSGASLSVDGVTLPWSNLGYIGKIPLVGSGGSIVFEHTRAGATTRLTYTVPPRPTIVKPAAGDLVERGTNVTITYVMASSSGVRPSGSDGTNGVSGSEQSETGMAFLDASGLRPGPGTIRLARRIVQSPSGSGFQTSVVTYTITSAPVSVSWQ